MRFRSSLSVKRLGTSPLFKILLMSSRKRSSMICVSLKRNTVCLPAPDIISSLRSSRNMR